MTKIIAIIIFILLMLLTVGFVVLERSSIKQECQEKYGENWDGASRGYRVNICIGPNGDLKGI